MSKKAIILLSGGLDSSVMLAIALEKGRTCYALSFDYNQKHKIELESAHAIAAHYQVPHHIVKIDPSAFGNSSLVSDLQVLTHRSVDEMKSGGIPNSYVPARNTLFIAYALGQCEILGAQEIYFGPTKSDYSGYPDCRPSFIEAYQQLINVATKQSLESTPPQLMTPLIEWDKTQVVQEGMRLSVPIHLTMSCYQPSADKNHCGICDACILRNHALEEASRYLK